MNHLPRRFPQPVPDEIAGVQRLHVDVAGRPREAALYVPRALQTGDAAPAPVVFMFHGAGGTPEAAEAETEWTRHADAHDFVVVFPQGTAVFDHRPANFLTNPRVWNDESNRGVSTRLQVDDVAFFDALRAQLLAQRLIDPTRVYVTGFSNGASMTFLIAARRSAQVAAIAPVCNHCYVDSTSMERQVPTLAIVGEQDRLVPYLGGEVRLPWTGKSESKPPVHDSFARWATRWQRSAPPQRNEHLEGVTRVAYHDESDPAPFWVYVVSDLGHHWPGGNGQLSIRLAGPTSQRLHATELIWSFFSQHALPVTPIERSLM